ncbi:MAG: ParB N-terminal domain-containing protein [Bacteroidota bacterium]
MSLISIDKSNVIFHDKLSEMPIMQLKTEITDDIPNNYDIAILDIDKVLSHIHDGNFYKKFVMDDKMVGLVKFIRECNKLIPPIIRNITKNNWTIIDGQHRIGLFIHMGIMTIPFLIRKDQMKYIENLKQNNNGNT